MRHPVIRPALAALGADLLGHLDLHQLRANGLNRRAQQITLLIKQHPLDDLLDRHPVGTGHAALLSSNREKSDDHRRRVGRNLTAVPSDPLLHQP
jgi:hypothetical protein